MTYVLLILDSVTIPEEGGVSTSHIQQTLKIPIQICDDIL